PALTPTILAPMTDPQLTHVDPEGRVRMVDVGAKAVTSRTATAEGVFRTRPDVVRMVAGDELGKADVLATARLAGIGAAKKTSELIPLCHQIPLSSVKVHFDLDPEAGEIHVVSTAKTTGRTGVEMEALTAVSVAGLTLHDMVKAVDPLATMDGVRLAAKTGGKRGDWSRASGAATGGVDDDEVASGSRTGVVLVSSTAAAAGGRCPWRRGACPHARVVRSACQRRGARRCRGDARQGTGRHADRRSEWRHGRFRGADTGGQPAGLVGRRPGRVGRAGRAARASARCPRGSRP